MIALSLIQIGNALFMPSKFLTITSENIKKTKSITASLSASLCILSGFPTDAYAQNIASEIEVSEGLEQSTIKTSQISNLKTYLKIPLQNENSAMNSLSDVKVEIDSNRDESNTKSTPYNQNKWKLCYAPQTKNLGNILLTDLSTVYAYDDEMDDNNMATRIENNGVSSHIFYKNLFFNGWINISGEYQDVDGFICRVIWKDLWVDFSSKEIGPTNKEDEKNHILPKLLQSLGNKMIFEKSSKFPDLYSVYSPCLFK